jgi:hypothetical protein
MQSCDYFWVGLEGGIYNSTNQNGDVLNGNQDLDYYLEFESENHQHGYLEFKMDVIQLIIITGASNVTFWDDRNFVWKIGIHYARESPPTNS